jgi:hypothetical protein
LGQRPLVPLLLLAPPFFPIILFGSTTLLTGMTGNSLHMQWPLTSQLHGLSLRIKLHAQLKWRPVYIHETQLSENALSYDILRYPMMPYCKIRMHPNFAVRYHAAKIYLMSKLFLTHVVRQENRVSCKQAFNDLHLPNCMIIV